MNTAPPRLGKTPLATRRAGTLAMIGIAAVGAAALSGCGPAPVPLSTDMAPVSATASEGAVPDVGSGSSTGGGAVSGASGGGTSGGPSGGGPSGGGQSGTGTGTGTGTGSGVGSGSGAGSGTGGAPAAPPAPTAKIASFRVVTQPSCPVVGTPDAPFSSPGNGVTIAWSVTGAGGAAIAVDDPGTYGAYGRSYPADGRLELSFSCGATGTTTHTYTVWPAGAEGVSKTLTVSARANG